MGLRSRRPRSGTERVWWLSAGIGVAAVALALVAAPLPPIPDAPFRIPWWVLVGLFYVAERTVVHFSIQRHAHSFSLSEIPLVLGLFFATPAALIVGQATGNLIALTMHRRQNAQKLVFNLAQFTLQAAVVILTFRAFADLSDPLGFSSAVGALFGVAAALVLANVLINSAIRLSGGRMSKSNVVEVLSLGGAAASMNGALALIAVNVAWMRPGSLWIALVPPIALFATYRAQVSQRQEHARLSAMYEATRELHRTPKLDDAVVAAARRALSMFGASRAEIALLQDMESDEVFVTSVAGDLETRMEARSHAGLHAVIRKALEERHSQLLRVDDDRVGHDAMAVLLGEPEDPRGVLLVVEPESDIASFSVADLALLEVLASQLSVSLENGRLEESLAALHDLKEELRHQAEHDPLTGLANRGLFNRMVADATDLEGYRAVLYLDLDDFKSVNDSYGHAAGDELLRMVAGRIDACCRSDDTVARLGGDEFAVLLVGLDGPDRAEKVAGRLLEALDRPFNVAGSAVFARASIGVAVVADGETVEEVLGHADEAMYIAKGKRKGSFHVHGATPDARERRRSDLMQSLQTALVDGEVGLKYQPIVELETGRMIGVEGLLRWSHPVHGDIAPVEALSVADEIGLMGLLGASTVARACRDAAAMQAGGLDCWVSVNLSPDQLEPGLAATVEAELAANGLDPSCLVIEITESAAIETGNDLLRQIHDLGVRIALDDFGTGYSSLARLDTLPISIVKVDRSFVSKMVGPERSPLTEMVLEIGDTLGLMTIAEGVESEPQRMHLERLGCRVGQGWLFEKAVDPWQLKPVYAIGHERIDLP